MSNLTLKQRKNLGHLVRWLVAIVLIIFAIFPVIWVISASVNPSNTLASAKLIPDNFGWDNYRLLFNTPQFPFARWLWNSVKISSITTILSVSITTLAAYAFSRLRFTGRQTMLKGICSFRFSLGCWQ